MGHGGVVMGDVVVVMALDVGLHLKLVLMLKRIWCKVNHL